MKPPTHVKILAFCSLALVLLIGPAAVFGAATTNWHSWRGPNQDGTSIEHFDGPAEVIKTPLWTHEVRGRGTPVVVDGRMFSFAYRGEKTEVVELLTALDPQTGNVIWEHEIKDYISDTVYNRYAVGAPTVDPETKNVYLCTAHGHFLCLSFDGELLWEESLMERFGRLTFPNGRAGCPVIEGNAVIVRGITAFWGAQGPARDRFMAFDKVSGELLWISTPGVQPKDSSFSTPFVESRYGKRVFYAGTGCGNLVGVNAADGSPLWRFQMSFGGVNASPVIHGDKIICIHGKENVDSSEMGRMVALRLPTTVELSAAGGEALVLDSSYELWRQPLSMFTSSPVLAEDKVFQITATGNLVCLDAETGTEIWTAKLGTDNIHSSPLYADGLLFVPMNEGVLKVVNTSGKVLQEIELEGNCLGAPCMWNGHLFVHTTARLYAFGVDHDGIFFDEPSPESKLPTGEAVKIRTVPADVLLTPGQSQEFRFEKLDANGFVVGKAEPADFAWEPFIPPTAKVKSTLDAGFDEEGRLIAAPNAKASAGMFKGTSEDGFVSLIRGRIVPGLGYDEDFEEFDLAHESAVHGEKFAYPPLSWIGARFKFDIREREGDKVFAKTLDRLLFQRATSFFGPPDLSNYTLEADVLTDGNRRTKSVVGLVNGRYAIYLVGNSNRLEITSNHERFKHSAEFPVQAQVWYRLKTKVVPGDGPASPTRILAKAWPRDESEPDAWTIELEHPGGHTRGAPGIFAFSPQAQKAVYIDNIKLYANEK